MNSTVIKFGEIALPILLMPLLYHVGSMDPADKGRDGASLEGHGLSVSNRPDAWVQICKLGGFPWWKLTNGAGRFLDAHEVPPEEKGAIETWAVQAGFLKPAVRWRIEWYDSEIEAACYTLCLSSTDAEMESTEQKGTITKVSVNVATAALSERMGFKVDDVTAPSLALVCWCEDQTDLDGIWWEDLLDVWSLSAARGVILARALDGWSCESVPRFVPGDDEGEGEGAEECCDSHEGCSS